MNAFLNDSKYSQISKTILLSTYHRDTQDAVVVHSDSPVHPVVVGMVDHVAQGLGMVEIVLLGMVAPCQVLVLEDSQGPHL